MFSSWKVSSDDIINQMEKDAHEDILTKLEAYLNIPLYLNEISHYSIENEVVDIYNKQERDIYFAGTIKSTNEKVLSFSYGTEQGEYYGARRNKNNEIEIMKSDAETDGKSTYYSITSDMTAGAIVEQLGKFDARTRDWYKIAKEKGTPQFSSTYKHFVMDDLAISAAYPIYDKERELKGVLGTHFILSDINSYLKDIVEKKNATTYIVEKRSGELVANSLEIPNFITLPDKQIKRLRIDEIDNKLIVEAYQDYKNSSKREFIVKSDEDKFHINIDDYENNGLNWIIITAIPESQFTAAIIKGFRNSLFFSLVALIAAIILWIKSVNIFLKPIYHLIGVTERFSKGDFSQRAKIVKNDEVGKLSNAFNNMAEELYILVNNLEKKVKHRTSELEKTNTALNGNCRKATYHIVFCR